MKVFLITRGELNHGPRDQMNKLSRVQIKIVTSGCNDLFIDRAAAIESSSIFYYIHRWRFTRLLTYLLSTNEVVDMITMHPL